LSEILTQDEIDALLQGLTDGEVETETFVADEKSGVGAYNLAGEKHIIKSKIPNMEIINDRFASLFKKSLSKALQKMIDISVGSIDILKYSEFSRSLPAPTSIQILKMEPLNGYVLCIFDSKFIFTMVDCFFGGLGRSRNLIKERYFTPIENRLIKKILYIVMAEMESAWSEFHEIHLKFEKSEINPKYVNIISPSEKILLIKFNAEIDKSLSSIYFCIPWNILEPISNSLYTTAFQHNNQALKEWNDNFKKLLLNVIVNIDIEFGNASISAKKLSELDIGDIIMLNGPKDRSAILNVEGIPKFHGSHGKYKGKAGFRISNVI